MIPTLRSLLIVVAVSFVASVAHQLIFAESIDVSSWLFAIFAVFAWEELDQ